MSINVLVYNGPGVSQTSLSHTVTSLRTLLSSNYTVTPITPASVISDPWPASCALFVIPGGRDLPYVDALQPHGTDRIKEYVRKGGCVLGFCAGSYFASKRVEWEVGTKLAVVGDRQLALFPGTSKGCAYPGFVYESEAGARLLDVLVHTHEGGTRTARGIYWNGGGYFDGADELQSKGVRVLARYSDEGEKKRAAAVACDVEQGRVILWGPHIEYPINRQPALSAAGDKYSPAELAELETARWTLLQETLELLGVHVIAQQATAEEDPSSIVGTLPQMLVAAPSKPDILPAITKAIESILSTPPAPSNEELPPHRVLEDAHDTFRFFDGSRPDIVSGVTQKARSRRVADEAQLNSTPRDIISFPRGVWPSPEDTPLFSVQAYFEHLAKSRLTLNLGHGNEGWGMGEALLYGERVTSTQTLFDKNPTLQRALPWPILSIATQQLSGRGRGSNLWLSPPEGCLQFSLLLRPPTLKPKSLVFVQYLFGLAVVEACRMVLPPDAGEMVRLKWPNDIYTVTGETGDLKKIGGILVTTNFSDSLVDIVVGCGLNVLNPLPTTSLAQLVPSPTEISDLTLERVAATILPVFEEMWGRFLAHGGTFEPFVELYLKRWLHSDKIVTVTSTTPHRRVRIVGITPDYGLLRTLPVDSTGTDRWGTPEYVDLQPDGNRFDMMAGLISLKK